jgi:flagellar protein FlgJ
MSGIDPLRGGAPVGGPASPNAAAHRKLRTLSKELEGVFLGQLFQAMRATVPENETMGGGAGQEMFTAMLDERMAHEAAQRMRGGIGDALYRQLSRRLPPEESDVVTG